MKDWASEAGARFMHEENIESQKWAVALQKHQTLSTQAPVLWEQVKQGLYSHVRSFNERVGKAVLIAPANGNGELTVFAKRQSGQRTMKIKFDSDVFTIACSAFSADGKVEFQDGFPITLNCHDSAAIASMTGIERSPEEVAGRILDGLMGWK
jgi:hypothetical protein